MNVPNEFVLEGAWSSVGCGRGGGGVSWQVKRDDALSLNLSFGFHFILCFMKQVKKRNEMKCNET